MPTLGEFAKETGRPRQRRWTGVYDDVRRLAGGTPARKAPAVIGVSRDIEDVARYMIRGFHDYSLSSYYVEPGFRRLIGRPLGTDPITVHYTHLRDDWEDDFQRALEAWHEACGFEFKAVQDPRVADIVIDDEQPNAYAERSFAFAGREEDGKPVIHVEARQINITAEWPGWSVPGTIRHELGHCLGLGHPGPYNGAMPKRRKFKMDDSKHTIMSYFGRNTVIGEADRVAVKMLYGA